MVGPFRRHRGAAAAWLAVGALAACSDQSPTEAARAPGGQVSLATAGPDGAIVPLVTGDVIVRYVSGVDHEAVEREYGLVHTQDMLLARVELVEVAAGSEIATARALAADPRVEFAEPNYLTVIDPCSISACLTPMTGDISAYENTNDTFRGYKWDLHNDGAVRVGDKSAIIVTTPKSDADIDWQEMYDHLGANFAGSAVVGIIDTGIRPTHQEFVGRIIAAQNFATGYPATLIDDRDGHGTHVAGIAAAPGNNALGVMGVAYAPNIKLISAKSCERYLFPDGVVRTSCPSQSTADAIVWAVNNGADVLNLSLGGSPTAVSGFAPQQLALQYARANGVLPFCATGNDGNVTSIAFPARFPECVAVGATNWGDMRASYSNASPDVDLAAPGGTSASSTGASYILSSYGLSSDAGYAFLTGTSMATPQATGLAAMLYATGMTDDDAVLARLQSTVDDLGPAGQDPEFGAGRINAFRAITGASAPLPPTARITHGSPVYEGISNEYRSNTSTPGAGGSLVSGRRWQINPAVTGSPIVFTGVNTLVRTFVDNGNVQVFMTVTESNGQTGATGMTIPVQNFVPSIQTVKFDYPVFNRPAAGSEFNVAFGWMDRGVNDSPWQWRITWGDGSAPTAGSKTDQSDIAATHVYAAPGVYTAILYVKDKDGGEGQKKFVVQVQSSTPPSE